ncbi:hypothetical protein J1779_04850 [Rahnella sp. FC061912-K]|uniref:P-loop NTPase fold protein n=1 Tax=Rahnella rivi TaxID=2816249 RepID=UPI001C26FB01|nr:P-loop NTPase fold protein [Rahnella rivi]MBU9829249.1 hypothetical protein [Rahnella rivi]
MEDLVKTLDLFFQSEDRVIVIKGDWGVGKTFFWENYHLNQKKQLNKIAYSYVSLFGKNSINDIKKEIFHYATPIDMHKYKEVMNGQDKDINGKFLPRIKAFAKYNRGSKFIIKYFDNTSFGFRASSLISALEYGFIKDYIICFDDLERKGKSLEIKELMGLVDELARKKNCKIILIFNERNLHDDLQEKQFSEYREKVVDLEVMYIPSVYDNLEKVFFRKDKNLLRIQKVAQDLNIVNLRIIRKIKLLLGTFDVYLNNAVEGVKQDFVNRATLFSLVYYSGVENVTYDDFKQELNAGLIRLLDIEEEEKKPVQKFIDKLDVTYDASGQSFDNEIDLYLRNGFINPNNEMNEIIKSKNNEYSNIELNNKMNKIWSIYTESFEDNDDFFISEIESLLNENLHVIPVNRLGNFMDMLESLGKNCDHYIEKFVSEAFPQGDLSKVGLSKTTWSDLHSGFDKLDEAISRRISSLQDSPSIENILIRFSSNDSYNGRDIIALNSFSEDDYYQWIISCEIDTMNLIRHGLLKFDGLTNPSPEQIQITEKAKGALRRISKISTLNNLRVRHIIKVN